MRKGFKIILAGIIVFNMLSCEEDSSTMNSDDPADKLVGQWNVSDTTYELEPPFDTTDVIITNYTATVVKTGENTIKITSNRTQPVYSIDNAAITVDWENKTLDGLGSITGEINNENSFETYLRFGANPKIYDVYQKYTR